MCRGQSTGPSCLARRLSRSGKVLGKPAQNTFCLRAFGYSHLFLELELWPSQISRWEAKENVSKLHKELSLLTHSRLLFSCKYINASKKEECDVGKEAVYNLSLLCRHALRRELCWKPKYRNISISSSYFWFGLRDFPNSRGSQWRTGQPWRACSKAERTRKLLWYPNRFLLFQGCLF